MPVSTSPATRCRARSTSSTRSCGRRRARPTTAGPSASPPATTERSVVRRSTTASPELRHPPNENRRRRNAAVPPYRSVTCPLRTGRGRPVGEDREGNRMELRRHVAGIAILGLLAPTLVAVDAAGAADKKEDHVMLHALAV